MSKKVEQINKKGEVILGIDEIFKPTEIEKILFSYFKTLKRIKNSFIFNYNGNDYNLLVKNITYLGHPHPIHKKRIQVSKNWSDILKKQNTFLLGIYHYKDNIVFALFDKKQRGKNSSAHISTIDILKCVESGIFYKTDKQNNNLIVFRQDKFLEVFNLIIEDKKLKNTDEIEVFNSFSNELKGDWNGLESYTEMIENKFSQAFQSEWPGFYLEYRFDKFLNNNSEYKTICRYIRNKKKGELDFDIEFIKNNFFGDLKTHSLKSGAILGNDKKSVEDVVKNHNKLWYIVLEIKTYKDSDHKGVVSKFWNNKRNEMQGASKSEDSYLNKMKHHVTLMNFYILEINKFNKNYISDFDQPKNSDGSERNTKIQINKRDIDNFVIYRKDL